MEHNENTAQAIELERNVPEEESCSNVLDRSLWTRKEYLILCAGVLIQAFAYAFENSMYYNAVNYVTAYFQVTSLVSILPTILEILRAALAPFYTKSSDVFGRAESTTCAMFFYLLGFVILGTSKSFVQFAMGQIVYGIGSTGVQILTQVLIADTTYLINRGIMFALWDMPSLINTFLAQALTDPLTIPKPGEPKDKWRNVYIVMGVLALVGAITLLAPLWHLQTKGKRLKNKTYQRRSVKWLFHEFDAVGSLLITGTLSLTLLPMILAKSYEGNWENPKILGMLSGGIVFLLLLILWEAKYTQKPIMSMKIWSNRTAFGGLVIGLLIAIMSNINYQYYTLYLVVSREVTFGRAILLERGYAVAWLLSQLTTAFLMKRFKTCRPFIWFGILIHALGVGLMIPARHPTSSDAFVVISQAIAGVGSGVATVSTAVSVTGVVRKQDLATVIGTMQILSAVGRGLGGALAGGVWTQYLPSRLAARITGPYDERLALNDPLKYIPNLDPTTKSQLVEAYSDSQMLMTTIACSLAVITCICALMMKDVDLLSDQTKQDEDVEEKRDYSAKAEISKEDSAVC
ncbi:MAG: major facilitator superfamily domain-containing protein [Benniella sp.]|nr:MAG: major facilitator superfamily domain-containing protein [Benniella sp.]